jgi:hypothetical protein
MNLLNDSKLRGLIEKAESQGFKLMEKGRSGHYKILPPTKDKPILSISSTPSDSNFYWELRRMLKRCGYVEDK